MIEGYTRPGQPGKMEDSDVNTTQTIMLLLALAFSVTQGLHAQQAISPEKLGARIQRTESKDRLHWKNMRQQSLQRPRPLHAQTGMEAATEETGAGPEWLDLLTLRTEDRALKVLGRKALAPRYGIEVLNSRIAHKKLDRVLFGMPWGSALYANIFRDQSGKVRTSMYVQVVSDILWNRLIYGDYEKFIKAYDASETGTRLNRPSGVIADHRGRVFLADAGNSRILELRFTGPTDDLELRHERTLRHKLLSQPVELAIDDRGTPFDPSDDLLWVIDSARRSVLAFKLAGGTFEPVIQKQFRIAPVALAVGRVAGVSDGSIYLATDNGRSLHRFVPEGGSLRAVTTLQDQSVLISSLAVDFAGTLFVADQAGRRLLVLTPMLEVLAVHRNENAPLRPVRLQTLTGSETMAGESPAVIGFDQVFMLEEWTQESGARRFAVLPDARIDAVRMTSDFDRLSITGVISEPGRVQVRFESPNNGRSFTVSPLRRFDSGKFMLEVDRSELSGFGVFALGLRLQTLSGADFERDTGERIYLPYFRSIDFQPEQTDGVTILQGRREKTGESFLLADRDALRLRISGLPKDRQREIRLSLAPTPDSDPVSVQIVIDGQVKDLLPVTEVLTESSWFHLPEGSDAVDLELLRSDGIGRVSLKEIQVREAGFTPGELPDDADGSLPVRHALLQNYPNPFNPSTTISYSIPSEKGGHVRLVIYDMLGREIRQLVDSELPPGEYRQVWDGRSNDGREVGSGVYFYTLTAGDFRSTRKMILVR